MISDPQARRPAAAWLLLRALLALALVVWLGGCAEKAQSVQVGAAQFESEALGTLDVLGTAIERQYTSPTLSAEEGRESFLRAMLEENEPLSRQALELYLTGVLGQPGSQVPEAWRDFLARQRALYSDFRAIFDRLDEGSLLAAPDVKEAVPVLDELLVRTAAIGDYVLAHPVEFSGQREKLAGTIESVRGRDDLSPDLKREQLAGHFERLLEIGREERRLQAELLRSLSATLVVGNTLRDQLLAYDRLSLDDILSALRSAVAYAADLTGQDFGQIEQTAQAWVEKIKTTPALAELYDRVAGRLTVLQQASE